MPCTHASSLNTDAVKLLSSIPADPEWFFSTHLFFVLLEFQMSPGGGLSLGLQALLEPLHQLVWVGLHFWKYCCHFGGWEYRSSQFLLQQHLLKVKSLTVASYPKLYQAANSTGQGHKHRTMVAKGRNSCTKTRRIMTVMPPSCQQNTKCQSRVMILVGCLIIISSKHKVRWQILCIHQKWNCPLFLGFSQPLTTTNK